MKRLKVYFLGSGAFAVPYLKAIAAAPELELIGVGTQPDRPAGRKKTLTPTVLGSYADEAGIPCERLETVNDPEFLERLRKADPDLVIVVSFGQLLKEEILNLPRLGCLNVHGSILPKYRGASPMESAILAGDPETGVTFMRMDKGLDTGGIYDIFRMPLDGTETAEFLEKKLSESSVSAFLDTVRRVGEGLPPVPQDESKATKTGKIHKSDGAIQWELPAEQILRKLRAYTPWPGCFFRISTKKGILTVRASSAIACSGSGKPGETILAGKRWQVACGSGAIELLRVHPEGGREMSAVDFLHGAGSSADLAGLLNGDDPAKGQ